MWPQPHTTVTDWLWISIAIYTTLTYGHISYPRSHCAIYTTLTYGHISYPRSHCAIYTALTYGHCVLVCSWALDALCLVPRLFFALWFVFSIIHEADEKRCSERKLKNKTRGCLGTRLRLAHTLMILLRYSLVLWWYGSIVLSYEPSISFCDLQLLTLVLMWLVIKNSCLYKLHTAAKLPHWLPYSWRMINANDNHSNYTYNRTIVLIPPK